MLEFFESHFVFRDDGTCTDRGRILQYLYYLSEMYGGYVLTTMMGGTAAGTCLSCTDALNCSTCVCGTLRRFYGGSCYFYFWY